MNTATLMKPLFCNGMFNREGKRIRAKHFKTITDGQDTYSLWVNAGKPDRDYVKNERDQYYLHLEYNSYIINMGTTDYQLEERASNHLVNQTLYGGSFEGRQMYFQENFYKGRTYEEYAPLVKEQTAKEEAFIKQLQNSDIEAVEVSMIRQDIEKSIKRYLHARDHDGDRTDFIGALFLDDLDHCVELTAKLNKKWEQEEVERRRQIAEERQKKEEEQEAEKNRLMLEAEEAFIKGGTIKGGEMIVMLAEKHNIDIPIRTKGWFLNSLSECILTDSGNISYTYWRKTKNSKGSQTAFEILSKLKTAIREAA